MSNADTISPPGSPSQGAYRVSRPMSPSLSRSNSGFFSVNSGTSGANRSFYRGQAGSTRTGSFILNTSAYTRPFKSRRIVPGTSEKPWLGQKKSKTAKLVSAVPIVGFILALAIVGLYGYTGWAKYDTVAFCDYWEDDFSNGFNTSSWTRVVQLDGFGTDEFEWTTPYENNSYVKDGKLYITPSLTWVNETDGYTLNLTSMGICTGSGDTECAATRNSTAGTYIPPVQSARLITKMSKHIKYGKVEVTARMPEGDWLWPAIWMMPVDSVYGIWPASGEIDIIEARGNDRNYYVLSGTEHTPAGNNVVGSTLHWGPNSGSDAYSKTTNGYKYPSSIDDLTTGFHTYGMEWTPNGIRTYIDQQLTQITYFEFPSKGFWDFGDFASNLVNPWFGGKKSTPFDQDFYLILNVAVGGTNGYFQDRVGNKPWSNGLTRDEAMAQFDKSKAQWYDTWTQPSMIVDKVVMQKTCKAY